MKNCIICNKEYIPNSGHQKCCSKRCSNINKYNWFKSYNKTVNRKNSNRKYERSEKRKKYKKRYEKNQNRKLYKRKYQRTEKCKKYRRDWMRKWNKTPKGKEIKNKWHRKRRAMKYNIIEKFSHSQFMLKVKKYKGLCANCKEPFNEYDTLKILTIDHIYPISLANNDFKRTGIKRVYTIEDVEPLCMSCNCSKKASLKKESL